MLGWMLRFEELRDRALLVPVCTRAEAPLAQPEEYPFLPDHHAGAFSPYHSSAHQKLIMKGGRELCSLSARERMAH